MKRHQSNIAFLITFIAALGSGALGASGSISAASAASAPDVIAASVSAVTTNSAVLEGSINPGGQSSNYHFEYGSEPCGSSPCTSLPASALPEGSAPKPVTIEVTGLQPDTTYYYRLIAENPLGGDASVDQSFHTYGPPVSTACPNAIYRVGASATLPDCRAYEMVSPVEKNGGNIKPLASFGAHRQQWIQSSPDGEKLTYSSAKAFADAVGNRYVNQYMGSRGPNGWTTHNITPPLGETIYGPFPPASEGSFISLFFRAFTPDLSTAWLWDFNAQPLAPGGVEGVRNTYRRNNLNDTYETVGQALYGFVGGFSEDSSVVVFQKAEEIGFESNEIAETVVAVSDGVTKVVSILPDGTEMQVSGNPFEPGAGVGTPGAVNGSNAEDHERDSSLKGAVSRDGTRVYWSAFASRFADDGTVYLRENPMEDQSAFDGGGHCSEPSKACTYQVSPGAHGLFWAASEDGASALISEGDLLYRYSRATNVTNLVAEGFRTVLGTSDDLSRFYFVSTKVLAPGAVDGKANVYFSDQGTFRHVATVTLKEVDRDKFATFPTVGNIKPLRNATRVSPDGLHVVFSTSVSLTGFDNRDAVSGEPVEEVYLYDARGGGNLECVSCNPSGERPRSKLLQDPYRYGDRPIAGRPAAAWIPTWEHSLYPSRVMSEDGSRVFFNSFDSLTPADTNGGQDVYEWEENGTGTCSSEGGCVRLISSGESPEKSEFVDASRDGRDVYFETNSSLLPQDPGLIDIYDAREGGGFPQPSQPAACEGEACQSPPSPPNDPTPASSSFVGPGNVGARPSRKRCKAKHRKHRRHQRCHRRGKRTGKHKAARPAHDKGRAH